jgi:hypothetical protein
VRGEAISTACTGGRSWNVVPMESARTTATSGTRDQTSGAVMAFIVPYSRRQLAEATAWQNVSRSADYAEPYPAEYPPDVPTR